MIDTSLQALWSPSPNHEARKNGQKPDLLLLHYTAMTCGKAAVKWLCSIEAKVSCHYLVDVDGTIVQMVRESERAWHAGVSHWSGNTDINSCSIGIEIQNEGHLLSPPPPYPDVQMKAVEALCLDIIRRHGIIPQRVLAHSDVAIGRKVDPGEAFDWLRLFKAGIGMWVEPVVKGGDAGLDLGAQGEEVLELQSQLKKIGYGIEPTGDYDQHTKTTISAFQRHWRQYCVDGIADMSTLHTIARLRERFFQV